MMGTILKNVNGMCCTLFEMWNLSNFLFFINFPNFRDGGDCCGSEVDKQFCKDCQCKDPTFNTSPTTTPRPTTRTPTFAPRTPTPSGICEFPGYKKDGACDDLSNNEDCNWDGGDCCGPEVNTELCLDCECLDPKYSSAIAPLKVPFSNHEWFV